MSRVYRSDRGPRKGDHIEVRATGRRGFVDLALTGGRVRIEFESDTEHWFEWMDVDQIKPAIDTF